MIWVGSLLAEAVEVLFAQSALEEGAGIHTWGSMALEEDLVTATGVILAAEEVVEAHFVQRGGAGIGGNMATYTNSGTLGAVHHDGGVPANPTTVALFYFLITGELWLHGGGDGVDEVGGRQRRQRHAACGGTFDHAQHQEAGAVGIGIFQHSV